MNSFPQSLAISHLDPTLQAHISNHHHYHQAFPSRFTDTMKSASLSYAGYEEPHFLEACTLCSKPLGHNSDIFMYRGNNPFCSQECRQEQIEIDEARERRWKMSSKKSTESAKNSSTTPNKATVRTGTLVVA